MQQSYASVAGLLETVAVPEMVEDAFSMNIGALARHAVKSSANTNHVPP